MCVFVVVYHVLKVTNKPAFPVAPSGTSSSRGTAVGAMLPAPSQPDVLGFHYLACRPWTAAPVSLLDVISSSLCLWQHAPLPRRPFG